MTSIHSLSNSPSQQNMLDSDVISNFNSVLGQLKTGLSNKKITPELTDFRLDNTESNDNMHRAILNPRIDNTSSEDPSETAKSMLARIDRALSIISEDQEQRKKRIEEYDRAIESAKKFDTFFRENDAILEQLDKGEKSIEIPSLKEELKIDENTDTAKEKNIKLTEVHPQVNNPIVTPKVITKITPPVKCQFERPIPLINKIYIPREYKEFNTHRLHNFGDFLSSPLRLFFGRDFNVIKFENAYFLDPAKRISKHILISMKVVAVVLILITLPIALVGLGLKWLALKLNPTLIKPYRLPSIPKNITALNLLFDSPY